MKEQSIDRSILRIKDLDSLVKILINNNLNDENNLEIIYIC